MSNVVQIIEITTTDGTKYITHNYPLDFVKSLEFKDGIFLYSGKSIGSVGSAIKFEDGGELWLYNGNFMAYSRINEDVLSAMMSKIKTIDKTGSDDVILLSNGNRYWKRGIKLHRDDGPAFEGADGSRAYYFDGKLHRDDGPAIILPNGTKEWFKDGLRHCIDGPAVIFPSGRKAWYLDGKRIRKREFLKESLSYQARIHREERLKEEEEADKKAIEMLSQSSWKSNQVVPFTNEQSISEDELEDIDGIAPMIAGEDYEGIHNKEKEKSPTEMETGWALPLISLAAAAALGIFKALPKKEKETANKTVQNEMVVQK